MKSWKNISILSLSPTAMAVLLSGCLFGENKTFFDYKSGTNGTGNDEPVIPDDPHFVGTGTSTGTSTGTLTSTSTLTLTGTGTSSGTGTGTCTDSGTGTGTDVGGITATGTGTGTSTGTSTGIGTATPTPTPSYGFCCNINTGHTVPASAMGCDRGVALFPIATAEECAAMVVTPSPTPALVCDPFENAGATGDNRNGIKGKLYSYNSQALTAHPYTGVNDFFRYGTASNADFYFNMLNTPTRAFDRGFVMSDGSLLKDDSGTVLVENFAFKFTGGIQLPQGMADKNVQFAVLSDDGAIFSITKSDGSTSVLNNDGNHPTRMACGTSSVAVSANQELKFELDYYQGPRRHIALILLWRVAGDTMNDRWCGQSGNSLFFDSTTVPSTPLAPWNDLMNRWEVVPADVFHIDGTTQATNPCQ